MRSVVLVGLLLAASDVWAQANGFSVNRFEPSERGSDFFIADSLDLRGHVRPAIGVLLDWGYRPLVAYNDDGTERAVLVRHQLVLHAGLTMNFWNRWRIGLDLPIALFQDGTAGAVGGVQYPAANRAAIADLRIGSDVRIVGEYGTPFQLAAGFLLWVPTGRPDLYTGDGTVRFMPRATVAGEVAWFMYSASLGFHFRPNITRFASMPTGSEIVLRLALGAQFANRKIILGPEVSATTVTADPRGLFTTRTSTNIEALLGIQWRFVRDWRMALAAGPGLSKGLGTPEVRIVFGVAYTPIPEGDKSVLVTEEGQVRERSSAPIEVSRDDRDNDGVANTIDACPDLDGIATSDPTTNGCPDSDGDGVFDKDDKCPFVAGTQNGCPADTDRDGLADAVDACPREPGPESLDRRISGCPDKDRDGIIDRLDRCPAVPGKIWSDPSQDGCP